MCRRYRKRAVVETSVTAPTMSPVTDTQVQKHQCLLFFKRAERERVFATDARTSTRVRMCVCVRVYVSVCDSLSLHSDFGQQRTFGSLALQLPPPFALTRALLFSLLLTFFLETCCTLSRLHMALPHVPARWLCPH